MASVLRDTVLLIRSGSARVSSVRTDQDCSSYQVSQCIVYCATGLVVFANSNVVQADCAEATHESRTVQQLSKTRRTPVLVLVTLLS